MSDAAIRERIGDTPSPTFESPAFTTPPPIEKARVAIVTTAGLQHPGDKGWRPQDPSFTTWETEDQEVNMRHLSPNFDRSGIVADLNVAYPVDRLKEMAAEGVIGSVAPRHLSFMGAQDDTMSTIRMDTGPAAAKLLKDDGVDVVLLTPV